MSEPCGRRRCTVRRKESAVSAPANNAYGCRCEPGQQRRAECTALEAEMRELEHGGWRAYHATLDMLDAPKDDWPSIRAKKMKDELVTRAEAAEALIKLATDVINHFDRYVAWLSKVRAAVGRKG